MQRFLAAATIVVAISACGGGDDLEMCLPGDRVGTYLVTGERLSGDCGEFPTTLVQVRDGVEEPDTACTTDYERWSDDACSVEIAISCVYPVDGYSAKMVTQLNDGRDDGKTFTAIASVEFRDLATGSLLCASTYDLLYTRQ